MKYFLLLLLTITACDLEELMWPADEHLALPGNRQMRMHCLAPCPEHEDILQAMQAVATRFQDHEKDPYKVWQHYAFTFSDGVIYTCFLATRDIECRDGLQIRGLTDHQRDGIWIHVPTSQDVLEWELSLVVMERILPGSTEDQKLEWMERTYDVHKQANSRVDSKRGQRSLVPRHR